MSGINNTNDVIYIDDSPIHGKGVFSKKEIPAYSQIGYFDGYEIHHDTYHSLTLDGQKIEPTGQLQYLNHSCDANAIFRGRVLHSQKDILPGDEITINYLDTEDNITNPFDCLCCTRCCVKIICSSIL